MKFDGGPWRARSEPDIGTERVVFGDIPQQWPVGPFGQVVTVGVDELGAVGVRGVEVPGNVPTRSSSRGPKQALSQSISTHRPPSGTTFSSCASACTRPGPRGTGLCRTLRSARRPGYEASHPPDWSTQVPPVPGRHRAHRVIAAAAGISGSRTAAPVAREAAARGGQRRRHQAVPKWAGTARMSPPRYRSAPTVRRAVGTARSARSRWPRAIG